MPRVMLKTPPGLRLAALGRPRGPMGLVSSGNSPLLD